MVLLGLSYSYPSSDNAKFSVYSIEEGYKFIFYEPDGTEKYFFTVNSNTIETLHAATGHIGEEGEAIELFRKFGTEQWPQRFR